MMWIKCRWRLHLPGVGRSGSAFAAAAPKPENSAGIGNTPAIKMSDSAVDSSVAIGRVARLAGACRNSHHRGFSLEE